jgi:EAL domain-containing protein (putative c-di-GMP-specific phosphodiesterase class I)
VTESLLLSNVDNVQESLNQLKAHGIQFSLDDFGTGYSSLSYLQHLPFDQLKIDKSFVSAIKDGDPPSPIISAIVALGQTLNMAVIAEGVETDAQRQKLAQSGCVCYQGYLYGRPVPIAAFEQSAPNLQGDCSRRPTSVQA